MSAKKRIVRKEIAAYANVSEAVVSYVINNSNYVSNEKRERVLQAIEAMGYEPNFHARALKTNKSYNICAIIASSLHESFVQGLVDISRVLHANDYALSLLHADEITEKLLRYCSNRFDGLFVLCDNVTENEVDLLNRLADSNCPIMLLTCQSPERLDPKISLVQVNLTSGIQQTLEIFEAHSVSKILCISDSASVKSASFQNIYQAVLSVAEKLSLRLDVCSLLLDSEDLSLSEILTHFKEGSAPLGIIVANDMLAIAILNYCVHAGFSVSRDFLIAGFGDTPASRLFVPSLSTLRYNKDQIFLSMANNLLHQIRTGETYREIIDTVIVSRNTTN